MADQPSIRIQLSDSNSTVRKVFRIKPASTLRELKHDAYLALFATAVPTTLDNWSLLTPEGAEYTSVGDFNDRDLVVFTPPLLPSVADKLQGWDLGPGTVLTSPNLPDVKVLRNSSLLVEGDEFTNGSVRGEEILYYSTTDPYRVQLSRHNGGFQVLCRRKIGEEDWEWMWHGRYEVAH